MCIAWKQSHSGGNGVPVLSALMQADLSLPRSHLVAEGTSEPWSAGITSSGPTLGKQGKSTCQYSTASSLVAALQSFGWKLQSRLQCTSWGGNESYNKTEQSPPLWSLDAQHVHRAVIQLTRAGGNLGFSFLRVITRSAVFSFPPVTGRCWNIHGGKQHGSREAGGLEPCGGGHHQGLGSSLSSDSSVALPINR